ncbi:hypothetical protein P5673_017314, partial [Acropora cervicornis]
MDQGPNDQNKGYQIGWVFLKGPPLAHCCFLFMRVSFLMSFIHILRPYTLMLIHNAALQTYATGSFIDDDKTEFLMIDSRQQLAKVLCDTIN